MTALTSQSQGNNSARMLGTNFNKQLQDLKGHPDSNKVMQYKSDTIILPIWVSLLLKKVDDVDASQGTCKVSFTMIIRVNTQGTFPEVKEQVMDSLKFRLNDCEEMTLDKSNSTIREDKNYKGLIVYTSRQFLTLAIEGDVTLAPFNVYDSKIQLEFANFELKDLGKNKRFFFVRFNLHRPNDLDINELFTVKEALNATEDVISKLDGHQSNKKIVEEEEEFGLARSLMQVKFRKEIKGVPQKGSSEPGPDSLHYIPIIIFQFSLFKKPGSILITQFFPLFVLTIFTLSVYNMENDFATRISNLGVFLLAYFAFIPSLRSFFPPSSSFTLCDAIIVLDISIVLISMVESRIVCFYQDTWNEDMIMATHYGLYYLSLLIFAISNGVVAALYLKFTFRDLPGYLPARVASPKRDATDSNNLAHWILPNEFQICENQSLVKQFNLDDHI